MLLSLENIVGCPGYFIDDQTYEIWSFKQYKEGRKIKLRYDKDGYLRFNVWNEGNSKTIRYHQLIVKVFIDPSFNSESMTIDHLDHNRSNNSLDNLRVVTRSENDLNRSMYFGKQAIYIDDIEESVAVNEEHGIYYSKAFDKFYRFVEHVGKYRELKESKEYMCFRTSYSYNRKIYHINCTKFREGLTK